MPGQNFSLGVDIDPMVVRGLRSQSSQRRSTKISELENHQKLEADFYYALTMSEMLSMLLHVRGPNI